MRWPAFSAITAYDYASASESDGSTATPAAPAAAVRFGEGARSHSRSRSPGTTHTPGSASGAREPWVGGYALNSKRRPASASVSAARANAALPQTPASRTPSATRAGGDQPAVDQPGALRAHRRQSQPGVDVPWERANGATPREVLEAASVADDNLRALHSLRASVSRLAQERDEMQRRLENIERMLAGHDDVHAHASERERVARAALDARAAPE